MRLTRGAAVGAASQVDGSPPDGGEDQGQFRGLRQLAASPRFDNRFLDNILRICFDTGPLPGKE
jgi:hypothetical protein